MGGQMMKLNIFHEGYQFISGNATMAPPLNFIYKLVAL